MKKIQQRRQKSFKKISINHKLSIFIKIPAHDKRCRPRNIPQARLGVSAQLIHTSSTEHSSLCRQVSQ